MFLKSIGVTSLTLAAVFLALASAQTLQQQSTPTSSAPEDDLEVQLNQLQSRLQQMETQVVRRPILPAVDRKFVDLPPLTVPLDDAAAVTSLQLAVTLECPPGLSPMQSVQLQKAVPPLQDWLIGHLSDHRPVEMLGSAAQDSVRTAIAEKLSSLVGDARLVQEVLFREFTLVRATAATDSRVAQSR